MEVFLFILIIALAGYALHLRSRVDEVEKQLESVLAESVSETQFRNLAARVGWLEEADKAPVAALRPEPELVPEPAPESPPSVPIEEPIEAPIEEPRFAPVPPPLPVYVQPLPVQIEEPVVAGPSLADRLRRLLGDEEWESLVGGSLLNKLGALVLVIGIALFLGFSLTHMTAGGRVSIALLVSVAVLGAGVWVERRERYRVFARGLIGAGWAGLYATAYAAYAIPEARVIENPFAGSLAMLLVAVGMIGHSLLYRAQAVTGVAYFAAFAALAATPSSPFAVVSLIPLAASILFLAAKFDWYSMALFGLGATYLTCISRGDSGAPLNETQALFLAYWLLFDAFDLLRVKRRVVAGGVEWIYPANLAGFIGLSYLAWAHHAHGQLWIASATGAALFLADSLARAYLRPPSSFEPSDDFNQRLLYGSYEGSTFVSAVLAGLAIVARVPGVWLSAGLAVEAEIVYLAGVRFGSPFLRRLGVAGFAHSLARLGFENPFGKSDVLGHDTWNWTPPATFHAVLFYLNRALRRPNVAMSSVAALLLAVVIAAEVRVEWVGAAWIIFGLALLEIGLRRNLFEFRAQAYVLLAGGVLGSAVRGEWPALAIGLAIVYGCALRSRWVEIPERREFAYGSCAAAVVLSSVLIWREVPIEYVALAWFGLALAILELGMRRLPDEMRAFFAPAGLLATAALVATHAADFAKFPAPPVWLAFFGAGVLLCAAAARIRETDVLRDASASFGIASIMAGIWLVTPDPFVSVLWTLLGIAVLELGVASPVISLRWMALGAFFPVYLRLFDFDLAHAPLIAMPPAIAGLYWLWYRFSGEREIARIVFWAAVVPVLALIAHEAGARDTAVGWMTVSLILLLAGTRFGIRDARLQSYGIAGLSFGAAILSDVDPPRLGVSCAVVAGLFVAQFISRRSGEDRPAACFSLLGTLLLCAVLYGEVSGGLLTVSWGFEGLALLAFGFVLRERVLRLQGLALLLTCILKLFVYDLRNLETLYRILSFVALGLILLAVSWIYTRFRDHIRKLL